MNEETFQTGNKIENIIAQVKGVTSARVIYENGIIVEIHVLADGSRSPKQVVRDIESAVLVKLGITVDHKCISVAQLSSEEIAPPASDIRLKLERVGYFTSGVESSVSITVSMDEEHFEATASGPKTGHNRLRLAAKATLSAIEKYLGAENLFILSEASKVTVASHNAIITVISYYHDSREETLLGAALAYGDELEAAAKSALDAINRKLVFMDRSKN